jgi:hypothetical protein
MQVRLFYMYLHFTVSVSLQHLAVRSALHLPAHSPLFSVHRLDKVCYTCHEGSLPFTF